MPRLLLTAVNYWPEPTGTAPYTARFAEHLAELGHDITVLAGMPHYPSWRTHPEYKGRSSHEETRKGVRIVRRSHHVPRHQSAFERARYEGTFLLHALNAARGEYDAVIGVVPSLNGGLLARMKSRRSLPYGVLFQDLMGQAAQQSGIHGGSRLVARMTRSVERWAVARATSVGAVSEAFFPYLRELGVGDDRLLHTPNWPLLKVPTLTDGDRVKLRLEAGWPANVQVALHAGNMGLKQGLEQIVVAASLAEQTQEPVHFVLLGDGNQRELLEAQARGLGNLTFMHSQDDEAYMQVLSAADVLLISERTSSTNMSLPSKLTAYYVSGKPVVAAVAASGATATEVERSKAGMVVPSGEPYALLRALADIRTSPRLQAQLSNAGPRYAASRLDSGAALRQLEMFAEAVLSARTAQH